ncbi:hypothetical protein ACSSS7_006927 [Eimeria intestinalis]
MTLCQGAFKATGGAPLCRRGAEASGRGAPQISVCLLHYQCMQKTNKLSCQLSQAAAAAAADGLERASLWGILGAPEQQQQQQNQQQQHACKETHARLQQQLQQQLQLQLEAQQRKALQQQQEPQQQLLQPIRTLELAEEAFLVRRQQQQQQQQH